MSVPLTLTAKLTAQNVNIQPNLVFSIDGIPTKFGASAIYEFIRIGDNDLYIDNYLGDPWYIGGYKLIEDQSDYISYSGGTTTRISQQLEPDKGLGTSASGLMIALIDKNEEVTRIISPGVGPVNEILGKPCTVQIGFTNNAYPEDYITIFKGLIETIEAGPGLIRFFLSSHEQKKRQTIFIPGNSTTTGAISDVGAVTTIDLLDATTFPVPVAGPTGGFDSDIKFYARIGNEFFRYTGKSGNTLTGVVRNESPLDYGQEAHDSGAEVKSVTRLTGSALDIARKTMISGKNGFYQTSLDITHFNYTSPINLEVNAIFFFGVNVAEDYGFTVGDYVTTTGAANGANNVSAKPIIQIETTNDGSYIIVDSVTFVDELNSSGTLSIRSQWDTYGYGCKMDPNDIDLLEFARLNSLFLGGFNYDFRLQNQVIAREFIESQILRPITSFSILRRGRTSMGFHSPPIPGAETVTVNQDNIENAPKLKIRRSLSKNYFNTVTYQFEKDDLQNDFKKIRVIQDTTSVADFNVGQRAIDVASEGMRDTTGGPSLATSGGNRFLNRYKRASEHVDAIEVRFGDIYPVDIGDNIVLDLSELKASDIKTGTREGPSRIYQVINKSIDFKTGKVSISVVDTNFSGAERYGLIAPASLIGAGTSQTVFTIKSSFNSVYGGNEYLKWRRFGTPNIRVRSPDGVTRSGIARIVSFAGNQITVATALGFVPQQDDIMEFPSYNDQDVANSSLYISMRDTDPFDDGKNRFDMI